MVPIGMELSLQPALISTRNQSRVAGSPPLLSATSRLQFSMCLDLPLQATLNPIVVLY